MDKSKGKPSERMQQAVDTLEYLVTFNRSISKAMTRTMQDLSEGVLISVANFTLAHRDSYLEYLRAGAPVHLQLLFPIFSYLPLKIDMAAILFPKQGHNYSQASFSIHLHFVQI